MKLQQAKDYLAVLSLCNGLLIAFLISNQYFILYFSLGISFISILFPVVAHYIDVSTKKILKIVTQIVFVVFATVLYFMFLTPLGLIKKIFDKKSPFTKNSTKSCFAETNRTYTAESFEKMG